MICVNLLEVLDCGFFSFRCNNEFLFWLIYLVRMVKLKFFEEVMEVLLELVFLFLLKFWKFFVLKRLLFFLIL